MATFHVQNRYVAHRVFRVDKGIMIKLASILFVLIGLACLISAIKPAYAVCRASQNRGWCLLLVLIGTFILGYVGFSFVLISTSESLVEMGVAAILGGGGAFVIVIIRLSLQSIEQAQLQTVQKFYEARHDALTGLPNRMHFMESLDQSISDAVQIEAEFAVLMLDLDRFKEINDTLGHAVGDKLLTELGARLQAISSSYYAVSRLGGDEFALILSDANTEEALVAAKELVMLVDNSFNIDDHTLVIDMSIGISLFPRDGIDQEALLKRADIAMYLAKQNTNHYMIYDEDEDTLSPQRLGLISRVKDAIAQEEFELHYQPVFKATGFELHGFEALIRWPQADGSFIPPNEFIPQIEQSRFIGSISRWVIRRSIQQLNQWSIDDQSFSMSVNLSAADLQDSELVTYIKSCVDEYDICAGRLCFEITESAIMRDIERAKGVINDIIGMGAAIALDDFGTGYSSLSLLREFPAQFIKIDQSFVKEMSSNSEDRAIVGAMIDLGHNLGRSIVAEGVEDEGAARMLGKLGCDLLQGYYLSRPMSYENATKWLSGYLKKNNRVARRAN